MFCVKLLLSRRDTIQIPVLHTCRVRRSDFRKAMASYGFLHKATIILLMIKLILNTFFFAFLDYIQPPKDEFSFMSCKSKAVMRS